MYGSINFSFVWAHALRAFSFGFGSRIAREPLVLSSLAHMEIASSCNARFARLFLLTKQFFFAIEVIHQAFKLSIGPKDGN